MQDNDKKGGVNKEEFEVVRSATVTFRFKKHMRS
jgi:hypothetical protein